MCECRGRMDARERRPEGEGENLFCGSAAALGSALVFAFESRRGRTLTSELFDLRLQRPADLHLLAADADFLQLPKHFLRHIDRQVDEAVIVANHDAADPLAL